MPKIMLARLSKEASMPRHTTLTPLLTFPCRAPIGSMVDVTIVITPHHS